jgi:peptidoglycan/xylan/chitin deacetylase (PgdA/CDA1 family)
MIVTYHEITPAPVDYAYSVTAQQFEEHLAYLAQRPGEPAEITFDDGHASHHRYALPLLERFGRKGIFFVTVGWTGTRPEYLSWDLVRELGRMGHQVQAHGWTHKFLTECGDKELAGELARPRRELEDRLGSAVDALSAPGGRWNQRVLEACAAAGYRRLYTSDAWDRGAVRKGVAVKGRFMVRRTMKPEDLERLLSMPAHTAALHRAKGGLQRMLRGALGEAGYQKLWDAFSGQRKRARIDSEYR